MDKEKKCKTSKSRRETAVQGTNDSSIVSKCSMTALGYFDDPYLQRFVSKVTRRAPLIHRGYYIRAKTIDFILKKFLDSNHGNKQIISLGAGFDSAYFRLNSLGLLSNAVFFEVDFPEVVKRKHALIKADQNLLAMVGEESLNTSEKSPHIELSAKCYKLLGVDLSQTNTLEAALKLCGCDFDVPTLLMSECVLTYMTRRTASGAVKWACETFSNSVFVLYEQINPSDAFGLFMQNHFHTMGSPLKCINNFPTIQSQRERFQKLGWSTVEAMDMNEFYNTLLDQCERDRVERLEMFDEYEEWHLKCAHYMVLLGYHGNSRPMLSELQPDIEVAEKEDFRDMIQLEHASFEHCLRRFGHGSTRLGDIVMCIGGFGEQAGKHMRVTEIVLVDLVTMEMAVLDPQIDNRVVEASRMHGTLTCLKDGRVLLIGGRLSPMRLCTQVVAMEIHLEKNSEKCMNCGERNCSAGNKNDNSRPKSDLERLCMNCSKMNISDADKKCDNSVHRPSESEGNDAGVLPNKVPSNGSDPDSVISSRDSSQAALGAVCKEEQAESSTLKKRGERREGSESERQGHGLGRRKRVGCTVIEQHGDIPSPRWRHSAVLYADKGEESIYIFGGRNQNVLALSDCYKFTVETKLWSKVEAEGAVPEARQSHTACLWNSHMVIASGLGSSQQPLSSVYMLNLNTYFWSQVTCDINPRYSHTAHMFGDILVLIGGVNMSHSPPGVAMIHLPSGISAEFALPDVSKGNLVMLHRHSSVVLDNSRVLLLGGGGNCFSFGTHLNSSPIVMDLQQALCAIKTRLSETEQQG